MRTRLTAKPPSQFIKNILTKRLQPITTMAKANAIKQMELAEARKRKAAESTKGKITSNGKQKTNETTTKTTNNTTNNDNNSTQINSEKTTQTKKRIAILKWPPK